MTQIRVSEDNEKLLTELRETYAKAWGFKPSSAAFANVVLNRGIVSMKDELKKWVEKNGTKK